MMRFLIADDHAIVRKGLIQILREEFASAQIIEVSNSNQVLEAVERQPWDVIMMDISMPGRNGIETLKQIRSNGIRTPILMLSMHPEDQYAVRVLKAGASGFLNKETATDELLVAIRKVLEGRKYITPYVAEKLASGEYDEKSLHDALSDREMQVLQLIATGKTVSEIASEISLSVNTISTYRTRILEKLNLGNNAELTRYAIDHNLTQ
jgi:two-component system, NarL family, invasion response regulator UvrY